MSWFESKYDGDIDSFKEYAKCVPWSSYVLKEYGIRVEMVETDVYHAVYDKCNDCKDLMYDRISSVVILVNNKYIPKDVFVEKFKACLSYADVTKYDREGCCDRVVVKDLVNNEGFKIAWTAAINLNPEYVYYVFVHDGLLRMISNLVKTYDPTYKFDDDEDEDEDEDDDEDDDEEED